LHAENNKIFRRHHVSQLLHRLGEQLPQWLSGEELIREIRAIEQVCWRELGYEKRPVFDGDLPDFLIDADYPSVFSSPADPIELAGKLSSLKLLPPHAGSHVGTNLDMLARLLNCTPFERLWLLWSYCIRRFGRAILPVIALRDHRHAYEVLARLADMPVDAVRDAVASRRLYAWGFLDGIGPAGELPLILSGWLSATNQFADCIEQPYASDSGLLTALCQMQVSLMATR
jgi:hypothetical protein